MKSVLLVWERGGNLGHLARLLPIAHRLRGLGTRVVFAVARPEFGVDRLAPEGFEWTLGPTLPSPTGETTSVLCHTELYLRMAFGHPEQTSDCVRQWCAVFEALRPHAIVVDASPLAMYAARCLQIPALVLGHGFEIPPQSGRLPCFKPWDAKSEERMLAFDRQLEASLLQLRSLLPVEFFEHAPLSLSTLFDPSSSALCTWPELDHFDRPGAHGGLSPKYVGPIWSEPLKKRELDWPLKFGPKVLCYLNLQDKRHDPLWQALVKAGANVVVISPSGSPRACEAVRGWGIEVVERTVNLSALLCDCDAVVNHGGMGTVSMALHAGKPLLLVPENVEQGILAYRLSMQGLAAATVRLRDKIKVQSVVDAILGNASLKARAEDFAKKYIDFKPEQAVNEVLRLLGMGIANPADAR